MRVLVIDHDADPRDLVCLCVSILGHTAEEASNTHQALQALSQQPYDVVLIDTLTPGPNVLEATQLIRAPCSDPQRPAVVVVSADLDPEQCTALFHAGALEAVTRPPSIELLRGVLSRIEHAIQPDGTEPAATIPGACHDQRRGHPVVVQHRDEA